MDRALVELADAYGVATSYWDWQGRFVEVDRDVVGAVLGVLGVDATRPEAELKAVGARPATVVVRQGHTPRVPDGKLHAEDGAIREVHGRLPAGLSPGWYRLAHGRSRTTVIVTPRRLPEPPRTWGWVSQRNS